MLLLSGEVVSSKGLAGVGAAWVAAGSLRLGKVGEAGAGEMSPWLEDQSKTGSSAEALEELLELGVWGIDGGFSGTDGTAGELKVGAESALRGSGTGVGSTGIVKLEPEAGAVPDPKEEVVEGSVIAGWTGLVGEAITPGVWLLLISDSEGPGG